ncbi:hypothetical protein CLHUN_20660 [Ruminiclostridium hungatei]|uniref:Uncharacterized protein n=1 Tax=Ruminiclostridium hungatei TaxID=48256 RepID=A0A1V4SLE1_RUMHU|nr:CBO0543 family protein [Ruminiclostridium hungatei]OPX44041.1 hypothetical protein CLHUN_20660 [Ruminiclostridium hungatei]
MTNIPKDVEIQKQLTEIHIENWLKNVVYHPKWFLLIFFILALFFIWWKAADKQRLKDISLYGGMFYIFILGIVEYGEELTLWEYPVDAVPVFPPLSAINLICLPVLYSLSYQYCKKRKEFIWASIIISAFICFVLEPMLSRAGFYHLIKWRHYYSFPLYALISIFVWYLTNTIRNIEKKNN